MTAEAAFWAKAGSVYPGDHSGAGELQHYKSMYQGFGASADAGKTTKNPLLDAAALEARVAGPPAKGKRRHHVTCKRS